MFDAWVFRLGCSGWGGLQEPAPVLFLRGTSWTGCRSIVGPHRWISFTPKTNLESLMSQAMHVCERKLEKNHLNMGYIQTAHRKAPAGIQTGNLLDCQTPPLCCPSPTWWSLSWNVNDCLRLAGSQRFCAGHHCQRDHLLLLTHHPGLLGLPSGIGVIPVTPVTNNETQNERNQQTEQNQWKEVYYMGFLTSSNDPHLKQNPQRLRKQLKLWI